MDQHNQQVQALQEIFRDFMQRRDFSGLFNEMYTRAQDGLKLPWVRMEPNAEPNAALIEWEETIGLEGLGREALVVGCGLGDDAEELARRGFCVTAFDFSGVAIAWCKKRFPLSQVHYTVADLLALPEEYNGKFAVVIEIFTLQSLPRDQLTQAITNIARTIAPGGTLFIVCLGADVPKEGAIPLPVTRDDLSHFRQRGLQEHRFEDFVDEKTGWRLFRVIYRSS